MYGSSRLGVYQAQSDTVRGVVRSYDHRVSNDTVSTAYFAIDTLQYNKFGNDSIHYLHKGRKRYEGTNHLGNVLVAYTDKRLTVCTNDTIHYYRADVVNAYEYSPFGAIMPDRKWDSDTTLKYRFGFNGKENDSETNLQDYGMRIYNPNLGKFLSVDPLANKFPFYTPYQFASNTPVAAIDIDGLESDKEFNLSEALQKDLEYLIKKKANEISLGIRIVLNADPRIRTAINIASKVSKSILKRKAMQVHSNAIELDNSNKNLQNAYHNTGLYLREYAVNRNRENLAMQFNFDFAYHFDDVNDMEYTPDRSKYFIHEDSHNPSSAKSIFDINLKAVNNIIKLQTIVNEKKKIYERHSRQFQNILTIYNTVKGLSLESIAIDMIDYYKKDFEWESETGKLFKERFKKLGEKFDQKEYDALINDMFQYYRENSESDFSGNLNRAISAAERMNDSTN